MRKTHRAVVISEAPRFGGPACEVSATLSEQLFSELAAPVVRIGALDAPIPMAPALEKTILPNRQDILAAARSLLAESASRTFV